MLTLILTIKPYAILAALQVIVKENNWQSARRHVQQTVKRCCLISPWSRVVILFSRQHFGSYLKTRLTSGEESKSMGSADTKRNPGHLHSLTVNTHTRSHGHRLPLFILRPMTCVCHTPRCGLKLQWCQRSILHLPRSTGLLAQVCYTNGGPRMLPTSQCGPALGIVITSV